MKTITELHAAHEEIPAHRIYRAIKRGDLKARKKKNIYLIKTSDFKKALTLKGRSTRDNRTFVTSKFRDLAITERAHDSFTTTAAADEFEQLLTRNGIRVTFNN